MSRVVAMVVGFCFILLFFFVPETFWDRTPKPPSPKTISRRSSHRSLKAPFFLTRPRESRKSSYLLDPPNPPTGGDGPTDDRSLPTDSTTSQIVAKARPSKSPHRSIHIGFSPEDVVEKPTVEPSEDTGSSDSELPSNDADFSELPNAEAGRLAAPQRTFRRSNTDRISLEAVLKISPPPLRLSSLFPLTQHDVRFQPLQSAPRTPSLHNFNSPFYLGIERSESDYLDRGRNPRGENTNKSSATNSRTRSEKSAPSSITPRYTEILANSPRRTFISELRPWNGRLHQDNWFHVAIRPFILFCYPAVLWSSLVYACSIGWLIVLSESVSTIYRSKETYNFSALSAGLIYVSPFIGGVLGTAVAGKVSDFIVRAMSRRNGGLYEPEFRLVMAIPVAITTSIGLMGYGWSAQIHDNWIVPTIFFGVISFGCSLGSTTAITFCVDSYRQYAGEALVTLNFSKNIFHGLVFSLFFNSWLDVDGSRIVFIALGIIQVGLLIFTIPMYIYGKRARMWTVRKNLMERF